MMPWVKTADRLPPDGVTVSASNRNGTIMPMRARDGEWFYAHRWERTKFEIVAWFDASLQPAAEEPAR